MQIVLNMFGLVAALLLSFISSGMETALYRVSRVRMRIRSERGETRAAIVQRVLDRLDAMVTTILINNNIAAYAGTYFLTIQLVLWRVPHSELVTTAVITPLFFILTESLPKQIAYSHADIFSLALIRAFGVFRALLSPMVWLLNKTSAALRAIIGSHSRTTLSQSQRALLLEHLSAGVAENVLTEAQNRMAVRIMQLEGLSAGESMVPLAGLTLLPASSTRARALAQMAGNKAGLALLIDPAGRPTGRIITSTSLLMTPGRPHDGIEDVSEAPERIRDGAAIPEVLNLFRNRHARHALVSRGNRVIGLITTQSVLDRIAGIGA